VAVADAAGYVVVHAYDGGWTANAAASHFAPDALSRTYCRSSTAVRYDSRAATVCLEKREGVRGVEFLAVDRAGWEVLLHMTGDPWKEERFARPMALHNSQRSRVGALSLGHWSFAA
jgi:hypothetical protein